VDDASLATGFAHTSFVRAVFFALVFFGLGSPAAQPRGNARERAAGPSAE
jgi:hypothetical protein